MSEEQNQKSLQNARKGSRLKKRRRTDKAIARLALFRYFQIEDALFVGLALTAAILKDILDLTFIGTFLAIPAGIFIAGMMFIVGGNKKMRTRAYRVAHSRALSPFLKKMGVWIGGTLAESLFAVDFLPVETLMVFLLYRMILSERKAQHEEHQANIVYEKNLATT